MHALYSDVSVSLGGVVIGHRTQCEEAFMTLLLNNVINPSVQYMHLEYKVLLEGRCEGYIKLPGIMPIPNELSDSVERYSEQKQGKIIKCRYSRTNQRKQKVRPDAFRFDSPLEDILAVQSWLVIKDCFFSPHPLSSADRRIYGKELGTVLRA